RLVLALEDDHGDAFVGLQRVEDAALAGQAEVRVAVVRVLFRAGDRERELLELGGGHRGKLTRMKRCVLCAHRANAGAESPLGRLCETCIVRVATTAYLGGDVARACWGVV